MVMAADPAARREVAERMADAARAWLDCLDVEQTQVATGAVPSTGATDAADGERRRWFYTPTDHGGLTLHQQRPAQQRAAMRLVASGLSPAGYVTVATTMGSTTWSPAASWCRRRRASWVPTPRRRRCSAAP